MDKEKVALDIVELLFKEQYLGRSEMWRLKRHLVDSVVFLNKNINFCKDMIRCTVKEMWGQSGVWYHHTMGYLFIQMSSEMWDCDMYRDLYF